MKNKLKIYSILLAVAFLAELLDINSLLEHKTVIYEDTGKEEKALTIGPLPKECTARTIKAVDGMLALMKPYRPFEVNVKSCRFGREKYLGYNAGEKSCVMHIKKAEVMIPTEREYVPTLKYIQIINIILQGVFALFIIVIGWILIVSVYKGEVFVANVARQVELVGGLICGMSLVNITYGYISSIILKKLIDLSYLNISWDYGNNGIYLILGLTLMVTSQIILRGKELQEEQELTI